MKRYLVALGVLVLALAASVVLVHGIVATGPDESRVRIVHAVPSPLAVDIVVDGELVAENVTYATVTEYETLPAGPHLVQVYCGISIFDPLISATVVLTGGMDFTVAGVGQFPAITSTFLVDNNHPTNANTVRVVNFSPDTSAINVLITGTMTSTVVSGVSYKGASSYIGGLGVGETSFEVRPSSGTTPYTFTATLDSGAINSVFIMGLPQSTQYPILEKHIVDARWPFRIFVPLVTKGG